jgi:phosphate starvation-inducible PhoH-like protein
MRQVPMKQRSKGQKRDPQHIKPKFLEERQESLKVNPLKPLNAKQAEYMQLIKTKPVVVATGYPGTSKTYLPVAMAADAFKVGTINKIILTRPAISSSKSVGYTTGDSTTKMMMWLGGAIPVFKERLGEAMFEIALEKGDIEFVPLEVVKGMSVNDAFMLCEESSDLTKDEVIKLVTRMGRNSTLVLAGDIRQSELRGDGGLAWLQNFINRHQMQEYFGSVDFNEVNDIVRSEAVKRFITNILRDEKKGIN